MYAAKVDPAATIERGPDSMGDHFDELSKAFASGTSRRAALKRFATGVAGAIVASVLPGRAAEAQVDVSECRDVCSSVSGGAFGRCVAECAACRLRGGNFVVLNSNPICIA